MKTGYMTTGEAYFILSRDEYAALSGEGEDAGDVAAFDAAREANAGVPHLDAGTMEAIILGTISPLTAWRKAAGLSQAALSERSGVRAATISEIESGRTDPRASTLKALANAFGVDVGDIVP